MNKFIKVLGNMRKEYHINVASVEYIEKDKDSGVCIYMRNGHNIKSSIPYGELLSLIYEQELAYD